MVRNGYPIIWKPKSFKFVKFKDLGNKCIQRVLFKSYGGSLETYDSILEKAGFSAAVSSGEKKLSEDNWIENFVSEQNKKTGFNENLSELSVKKLKNLLSTLVLQENYEKAARVRDELSKRKK